MVAAHRVAIVKGTCSVTGEGSFVPTLPVSGRGGRALHLGNKAAEDP